MTVKYKVSSESKFDFNDGLLLPLSNSYVRVYTVVQNRMEKLKSELIDYVKKHLILFLSSQNSHQNPLHPTLHGVLLSFSKNIAEKIISPAVFKHFYRIQSRDQVRSVSARG